MKRFLLTVFFGLASLFVVGSFALWLVLSAWVPSKGKAVLIQEAERRWPVTLAIGTVRYNVFQGFLLTDVRLEDRQSKTLLAVVPSMQVYPDWVSLTLLRTLTFRGRAQVESPLKAAVTMSGRYHLDRHTAALSAQSAEANVKDLGGLLAGKLPSQLTDGMVRAQAHVNIAPGAPPTVTGRVIGTNLVWQGDPWKLTGGVTVNGSARPPAPAAASGGPGPPAAPGARQPWSITAAVSLEDATLAGVPKIGTIAGLKGTAKLFEDRLEAIELSGDALSSHWRLEGDLRFAQPRIEALVTSRVPLEALTPLLQPALSAWRANGETDVRAVCRGPLAPTPSLDCLVRASVVRAEVEGPPLPEPVTGISGVVDYDVLAKELAIGNLSGTLRRQPVRLAGRVRASDPMDLSLTVEGALPLDLLPAWLPPQPPVTNLAGEAGCKLTITGRPGALQVLGRADLRQASARLAQPALELTGVTGTVVLSADALELQDLDLAVNGQPLTLRATVRPPPLGPKRQLAITGSATTPSASVQLAARLTPEDLLLDQAELIFSGSTLKLLGTISRQPERPSRLSVAGRVELEEVGHLPFVSIPALEQYRLGGLVDLDAQFRGRWTDWPSAELRARIGSKQLIFQDVKLDELTLLVEQNNRVLRASVPSAMLAGGRAVGELVVEHRAGGPRFLGQAEITGLQLDQLAVAVPAWKKASVKGQASGRLVLSGDWQDQATWRGEGWMNSSGEHLGELPLLDKVFQRAILGALADLLGLEPLRRAKITQASLTWKLADRKVHTQDLRLAGVAGIGAVVVYLRGSVGLDQQLELEAQPEFSEQLLSQSRALAGIAQKVPMATLLNNPMFRYRISGTLKDPIVQRPSLETIIPQLLGGLLQNLFGAPRGPSDPSQPQP